MPNNNITNSNHKVVTNREAGIEAEVVEVATTTPDQ
jgi:hypothetical protein